MNRDPLDPALRQVVGLALPDVARLPTRDDIEPIVLGSGDRQNALGQLLHTRRTTRQFSALTRSDLLSVLSAVVGRGGTFLGPDGYIDRSRPYPSAGGRHPHTLLILTDDVSGVQAGEWILDDEAAHVLPVRLDGSNELRAAVKNALNTDAMPPATILTLARRRRTVSKYPGEWGESLVWRDAGVLLGTLHLVAHDLGLASAILGISDNLKVPIPPASPREELEHLTDTGALAFGNYRKD